MSSSLRGEGVGEGQPGEDVGGVVRARAAFSRKLSLKHSICGRKVGGKKKKRWEREKGKNTGRSRRGGNVMEEGEGGG